MLYEIFETTNILNLELQNEQMDVVTAFKLSQTTINHLDRMKECDFEDMFNNSLNFCKKEQFITNSESSRRTNVNNLDDQKIKHYYQNLFSSIINAFTTEIIERFNPENYEPLIELYESFTNCNYERVTDYDKIKIYSNVLDFDHFKSESKSFVCYKQKQENMNCNNLDEIIVHFDKHNLKKMFPEVFKAIKLYLSVPACTTTAERSFSCLKLIKTWLRSTMKSERLSNLAIIKMNNVKKMEFQLDVNQVIDDFISIPKSGRNLKLK
jgi:spore coat protein CotF